MNRFEYARAGSVAKAVQAGAASGAAFLAGGTNLVDLMKENVARPSQLIDINRLDLAGIEELPGGGLRLGALATNATPPMIRVQQRYPLLASAILAGASPQLRNAATNGGNLNQRTDVGTACNERAPGSGCGAIGGVNRIHAILGASEGCIATNPSDMCVALAALEAVVRVSGPAGARTIGLADYHRLPGDDPSRDNTLAAGELVTAIDLPADGLSSHYTYLKLRDSSPTPSLVSVAAALRIENGVISVARVALGGVARRLPHGRRRNAAGRGRAGRERLQDRIGAQGDRAGVAAGGQRHAAIADRQARGIGG